MLVEMALDLEAYRPGVLARDRGDDEPRLLPPELADQRLGKLVALLRRQQVGLVHDQPARAFEQLGIVLAQFRLDRTDFGGWIAAVLRREVDDMQQQSV